jgi:hypothetical protein
MKKYPLLVLIEILLIATWMVFVGCKQSYAPPAVSSPNTYLVVEGFINHGPDSTYFSLTHTFNLSDTSRVTPELNARVTVDGNDNSSFTLGENGNGSYGGTLSGLNNSVLYRLHILTTGGKEYASDFVPLKPSPPIDSVSWTLQPAGVQIDVNTHDPQNATRYYRWDYQETWEIHSAFFAVLQYTNGVVSLLQPNTIYQCWQMDQSTQVFLGSSAQLAQDVIYQSPLVLVPRGSPQISVLYSIQVRQYALTADAYAWWQTLQKNTEQLGTLFGVQPTANMGNIHNVADSTEQVIGYVSGGTLQKQRIFITDQQVFPWNIKSDCLSMLIPPDSLDYWYHNAHLLIDAQMTPGLMYDVAPSFCVDCTLTGSNQRPSFWP